MLRHAGCVVLRLHNITSKRSSEHRTTHLLRHAGCVVLRLHNITSFLDICTPGTVSSADIDSAATLPLTACTTDPSMNVNADPACRRSQIKLLEAIGCDQCEAQVSCSALAALSGLVASLRLVD